jgi:sugar phosphate isomerase/epimerase
MTLTLDAYSRFLHWLRDPNEIAEVITEITLGGLMVTVGGQGSHVNAANVTTELPTFVNTIRRHGLKVRQIRGGGATDVDASVEALVGTMGQLGITHYWLGTDNYDLTKPIMPQLDAVKRKVERFVALNQKHGTTLMYHTRAGASSVGGVVWDLLSVLKDFDPKHVGFHWDTGHMSHHADMAETLFRTAGPYIVAMAWKDRTWRQDLGNLLEQGGPYPGPAPAAAPAGRGGGGGRGAAAGAAGAAGGGRGGGRGGAAAGGPAEAGAAGAAAAGGGRGGGRGGGAAAGGAAAAGGRGGGGEDGEGGGGRGAAPAGGRGGGGGGAGRGGNLDSVPRPLAGTHFAKGGGWTSPYVPMGMGLVDIFMYGRAMRDINFNGPMELEVEYPLGGANSGATAITLPRIQVVGALKRDVLTIRAALKESSNIII